MQGARNPLMRSETLHDDLSKVEYLSYEDAERVVHALEGWLPSKLSGLGYGDLQTTKESQGEANKYGDTEEHSIRQIFGQKPQITEIEDQVIIEAAGPTKGDRSLKKQYGVEPSFTSNIAISGEPGNVGKIDFAATATELPFADGQLDGVFISCLPGALRKRSYDPTLRDDAQIEAKRVLRQGGRLFWSGGTQADYDHIASLGFMPEYIDLSAKIEETYSGSFCFPRLTFDGVFVKQ